jgi:hypothetical protein
MDDQAKNIYRGNIISLLDYPKRPNEQIDGSIETNEKTQNHAFAKLELTFSQQMCSRQAVKVFSYLGQSLMFFEMSPAFLRSGRGVVLLLCTNF